MNIVNKYSNLHNKMNQNIRRDYYPHYQIVPFDKEKEDLFNSIQNVNFQILNLEQIKFIEKLQILNLLAKKGTTQIKSIFTNNNLNITTAISGIQKFLIIIESTEIKVTNIENVLEDFFKEAKTNKINNGNVLTRMYFKDGYCY